MKFLYDLMINILGGIISGLIITWIFKPELKKVLSKDALRRIFSKEVILICLLVLMALGYFGLVKRGIIPPYEFRDDMIVYDGEGNEFVIDGCHPERPAQPTGVKRDFENENKLFGAFLTKPKDDPCASSGNVGSDVTCIPAHKEVQNNEVATNE